jgi:NTE family protein
MFAIEI